MTDLTPNIPEVVAEVSAHFERYEQALIDKNVEVLDATFWNSPHTIRLANHEHTVGAEATKLLEATGAGDGAVRWWLVQRLLLAPYLPRSRLINSRLLLAQ